MPYFGTVPADPSQWDGQNGSMNPQAITLHRTYGGWGGDYSVGKFYRIGGHHFLLGKEEGQWAEFYNTTSVAYHCNGSNYVSVGIEITGTNEEPLTDWQAQCLGTLLHWLSNTHNIPLNYTDPESGDASVRVNGTGFRGVISHRNVATDDGSSQHTDFVTVADFNRAVGASGGGAAPDVSVDDMEVEMLYKTTDNGQDTFYRDAAGILVKLAPAEAAAYYGVIVNGKVPVISLGGGLGALAFNASTVKAMKQVGLA